MVKLSRIMISIILAISFLIPTTPEPAQPFEFDYPASVQRQSITNFDIIHLNANHTNMSINRFIQPAFTSGEVLIVILSLSQNFSKIVLSNFTLILNGFKKSHILPEGSLEGQMQLLFNLDDKSKFQTNSQIELTFFIETIFDPQRFATINNAYHDLLILDIQILSVSRSMAPGNNNSFIPATFIPNKIYNNEGNFFIRTSIQLGVIQIPLISYVLVPKDLNVTHHLNITIRSNVLLNYKEISIEGMNLISELPHNTFLTTVEMQSNPYGNNSQILKVLEIRIDTNDLPPEGVVLELQGKWYYKEDSKRYIDQGLLDLVPFLIASLTPSIPILYLGTKRKSNFKKKID